MGPNPDRNAPAPTRLTQQELEEALAAAAVLCHFVASSPVRTGEFRVWIEDTPGELTDEEVADFLAHVHDLAAPDCPLSAAAGLPRLTAEQVAEAYAWADAFSHDHLIFPEPERPEE